MVSSETQVVQSPPTHPEQHWRPSLRLKLLHLDPGQREPHLPAPSHISVTSTLAAHHFSSKPVLTSRLHSALQPPGGVPTTRARLRLRLQSQGSSHFSATSQAQSLGLLLHL